MPERRSPKADNLNAWKSQLKGCAVVAFIAVGACGLYNLIDYITSDNRSKPSSPLNLPNQEPEEFQQAPTLTPLIEIHPTDPPPQLFMDPWPQQDTPPSVELSNFGRCKTINLNLNPPDVPPSQGFIHGQETIPNAYRAVLALGGNPDKGPFLLISGELGKAIRIKNGLDPAPFPVKSINELSNVHNGDKICIEKPDGSSLDMGEIEEAVRVTLDKNSNSQKVVSLEKFNTVQNGTVNILSSGGDVFRDYKYNSKYHVAKGEIIRAATMAQFRS